MQSAREARPSLTQAILRWWREHSTCSGSLRTLRDFTALLGEFLLDSLPSRRRQRYGDADFDWDHRVDTTSATVKWRDRLLGMFHSPYQPTEPALFHEMLGALKINLQEFVFIDMGSGKGRTLLMASDHPFRRIIGVELLPALHQIAYENIRRYKGSSQRCFALESVCGNASEFSFPPEPLVLFLFNPLPEAGLIKVINNLEQSLWEHPRSVYVLYHNPVLEHVLAGYTWLKRIGGTHQYVIYASHFTR